MIKRIIGVAAVLALLAATSVAEAAGPLVTKGCTASWGAQQQRSDGSFMSGTVTYNLYIIPGEVATLPPGSKPTVAGITGTSVQPCGGLTGGQYTAFATTVETLAAGSSESAPSSPFPFVLAVPNPPPSLNVK